ncbi:5622_t:CDS:2 [Gigaspora rosea]|nr:5622_t:CDS:2 [Gigaspora rosea]
MALQTVCNKSDYTLIVDSSKVYSNKFKVEYIGTGKEDSDSATIRTNQPIPSQQEFYFEATILNKGQNGIIGIGFCTKDANLNLMPVPKKDIFEEELVAANKEENQFTSSVKEGDTFKEDFDMENFDVLPFLSLHKENIKTMCTSLIENKESLIIVKEWAANAAKNFEQLTRTSTVDKKSLSTILTLLNKLLNEESYEINKNMILDHILEILMFETDRSAANVNQQNEKILEEAALKILAKLLTEVDSININYEEVLYDIKEQLRKSERNPFIMVSQASHKMFYIKQKFLKADDTKKKKLLNNNLTLQSFSTYKYISKIIDTREIQEKLLITNIQNIQELSNFEYIGKTIDTQKILNILSSNRQEKKF